MTARSPVEVRRIERVVVRGVNWLGDAVMSQPALRRLREAYPDAHIALLTPEKLADLWIDQPDINSVLTLSARDRVWDVARRLRQGKFDLTLVFPNSPRSALEAWLAGIPRRIGYAHPLRNLLLTHAVARRPGHVRMRKPSRREIRRLARFDVVRAPLPADPEAHHLQDYLHLAAFVGARPEACAPRLVVTPEQLQAARARLGIEESPGIRWIGLNPGAEYGPAKRWPAAQFATAAIELHQRTGCGCVLLGGPADHALAAEIELTLQAARVAHLVNLAGRTTLQQLSGVMACCSLVLTNDTGPMHLAAAVGAPVVVPFGSTSPTLTGPGLPGDERHAILRSSAPCSPCFLRECPIDLRCMRSIGVTQVVEASLRFLKAAAKDGG